MLLIKDIHKYYGNLHILKGVSFEILPKSIVSIVGASGAGKSTLLHILGTLDKPDSGQMYMNQINVFELSANELANFRNKHIGFVFQFHHLLPEFTALENIMMPARIAGVSAKIATTYAEELLERLGLSERKHHKPADMSGGEQQRVAIARALINKPSIVFADEPTGNLDSENAVSIFEIINALRHDLGQTFVMVTHNEELAALSDSILRMKDGRIL